MTHVSNRWIVPLAASLALAGCGKSDDTAGGNASATATGKPIAPIAAPAGTDWTETVSISPIGGFVMGNPNAPIKLVEYASVTCPHCAEFSEHGAPVLRDTYVKSGQVSWEFRTFLLNGIDAPVSILARCQGPTPFFKLVEQLYAGQRDWIAGIQAIPEAEQQRLSTLPAQQSMGELVKAAKLDAFFRQRGVPEARINECLADTKQTDALTKLLEAGRADNITGTPSFLINGVLQADTFSWETLEPKLKAAVAG